MINEACDEETAPGGVSSLAHHYEQRNVVASSTPVTPETGIPISSVISPDDIVTSVSTSSSSCPTAADSIYTHHSYLYQTLTPDGAHASAAAVTSPIAFCYLPREPPPPYTFPDNGIDPIWTSSTSGQHHVSDANQPPPAAPPPPYRPVPACYYRPSYSASSLGIRSSPPDYLSYSLCNVLLCCHLFGLIALVRSIQVRGAVAHDDFAAAERYSASARIWNAIAVASGGIFWSAVLVFIVVFVM